MKTIEEVKKAIGSKIESANCELDGLCTTEDYMIIRNLKVEINAYNDCLSLLEECEGKEKPMKVLVKGYDRSIRRGYGVQIEKVSWHYCPNCKTNLNGPKIMPCDYCPCCGQRLDWGEGEKK